MQNFDKLLNKKKRILKYKKNILTKTDLLLKCVFGVVINHTYLVEGWTAKR